MLPVTNKRIASIDILRGMVMVVMALDHTRDYFSNFAYNPTDLEHTNTTMFFTRWVTHFCAPIFIFLSGTSAYLSLSKGKTKKEASLFLLKRGVWLVILELTIVRFGWLFNLAITDMVAQVIWAIGWSMVCLAGLLHLPRWAILTISLLMIFGHNALDAIHADAMGDKALYWRILHEFGYTKLGNNGAGLMVIYPLVPWVGIMAAGYVLGGVMLQDERQRNNTLYKLGISAIVLFIVLRYTNLYGDAKLWQVQDTAWFTVLSFINCSKYPPSLLYLLMTIGPALIALPLLERINNMLTRFFTVFGRVPMFYYILHIYLIHGMALAIALCMGFSASYFTGDAVFGAKPGWGFGLPMVYVFWLLAVALLYLPCRWFMFIKMNYKKWWLSYI
ncbi:hypothetical protein CAP35_01930 [Chitinophagaceae bacterium IBVUCB1]|nr:hypothetical protein CAP35_01930 [Chitinophagaceae bacterium IBVUCB1]